MTIRLTLLGSLFASVVAVVLLVLFVSRPTRSQSLVAQLQVGRPVEEAKAVLGAPDLGMQPRDGGKLSGYIWAVQGDHIIVRIDEHGNVTSVSIQNDEPAMIEWIKRFVALD